MVGIDVFAVADAYYEVGEVRRLARRPGWRRTGLHPGARLRPRPAARASRCCASPRVACADASRRSPPRWPPAPAAGSSGLRCTRPRSRSRSPPATSTWPRQSAQEVAETAGDVRQRRPAGRGAPLRRGRAARPRPDDGGAGALRMAFNEWKQLDVPFEAAARAGCCSPRPTPPAATPTPRAARGRRAACFDQLGVMKPQQPRLAGRTPPGGGGDQAARLRARATARSPPRCSSARRPWPGTSRTSSRRPAPPPGGRHGVRVRPRADGSYDPVLRPRAEWVVRPMSASLLDSYVLVIGSTTDRRPRRTQCRSTSSSASSRVQASCPPTSSRHLGQVQQVLATWAPRVQWQQSYVTDDKIYCVYIAEADRGPRARRGRRLPGTTSAPGGDRSDPADRRVDPDSRSRAAGRGRGPDRRRCGSSHTRPRLAALRSAGVY